MSRLFILLFVLNTLLPSVGFTAMLSADTKMMSQDHSMTAMSQMDHGSKMDRDACDHCDGDTMSNDMCKAQCAASCVSSSATHISSFSFDIPFVSQTNPSKIELPSLYSRSTPPELRPPLA